MMCALNIFKYSIIVLFDDDDIKSSGVEAVLLWEKGMDGHTKY